MSCKKEFFIEQKIMCFSHVIPASNIYSSTSASGNPVMMGNCFVYSISTFGFNGKSANKFSTTKKHTCNFNHNTLNHRAKNNGFNLIELMVVISIITIVCLALMPYARDFLISNAALTKINGLENALKFSRASAISRGENIIFCKSLDKKTCCKNCDWSDGQLIITKNAEILRVLESLPKGDKLKWKGNLGKNDELQFLPSGITNGQQGSFLYCSQNQPKYARAIIINLKGRAYVKDKTADEKPISCY